MKTEKQLTFNPGGHVLTNTGVWSPDGQWIVYDIRSDRDGSVFDGDRIEKVNVRTGEVRVLYEAQNGAKCGVATYSPVENKVVFILGPENPSADWSYGPARRRGVIVDESRGNQLINLDARDLAPPYTPGALRGGTHLHVFSGDGQWVSFTYEDHVVGGGRIVGVSVVGRPTKAGHGHPRNHDGEYFTVLVTRTSGQITRAYEEAWVGVDGYLKADGTRQKRAIAFLGKVGDVVEVFIVDIPNDVTAAGEGPLEGTETQMPWPPRGTMQRRLTYTSGVEGARHWVRSSPDGSRIAFLMKDERGVVQIWTVGPNGGEPVQVTGDEWDVASAFSWRRDGGAMAYVMDGSVFSVDARRGKSRRVTEKRGEDGPLGLACVYSPDGGRIAYLRRVGGWNQVFVAEPNWA